MARPESGGPGTLVAVKRMGILVGGGSLAAVGVVVGLRLWRRMLDWGATAEEVRRPLRGDELLPDACLVASRAIEGERVLATSTDDGTWARTRILEPAGGATRPISRTRTATAQRSVPARVAPGLLLAPGSWVMERRMAAGLRDRSDVAAAAVTRASPRATGAIATEIAPDVYLLGPWGRTQTNAYLVRDGSSCSLVDAGWGSDGPRIQAAARSLLGPGLAPAAILLTHAHPDHSGSARELAEAWGCPVYTHPAEVPLATGDFAAMARYAGPLDRWLILPLMRAIGRRRREAALAGSSLTGIVRPLGPGGAIPGVEGWEWIHTPGHTPGHVAYVRARDRVVLSGDAILTLEVNAWSGLLRQRQGLSGPPWYTTWDRQAAAASIVAIADLEPSVLAAGHGLPLAGPGTAAAVREFASRTTRDP